MSESTTRSLYWWIGHSDWERIREVLNHDENEREKFRNDSNYVASILSFALNFDAPMDLVEAILMLNPNAILTPNGEVVLKLLNSHGESLQGNLWLELLTRRQAIDGKVVHGPTPGQQDQSGIARSSTETLTRCQYLECLASPKSAASGIENDVLPQILLNSLRIADFHEESDQDEEIDFCDVFSNQNIPNHFS